MKAENILIVNDNRDTQIMLSRMLREEGFRTVAIRDWQRAIRRVKEANPDLVLLDFKLPGINGIKLMEEIKKVNNDLAIIIITAHTDIKDAVRSIKLGAYDYITKPFNNEELILTIRQALQANINKFNIPNNSGVSSCKKTSGEELLVKTPGAIKVFDLARTVAPTNMTVLLQGESGTGKEIIARYIHQNSLRGDKPLIVIDCGAIPDTLIESELFGYEKGAFTGADKNKKGRFEQAHGGTLFLDEINNLSHSMQMKLLRVLQEREICPLGGNEYCQIDVRIISATNIPLFAKVRSGEFRKDLFHRLNEFVIEIPPIRERKEDIPPLANHFLVLTSLELSRKIEGISTQAMNSLINYTWPGNIRELKNVIKKAVLLADSGYIGQEHLGLNYSSIPKDLKDFNFLEELERGKSLKEIAGKIQSDYEEEIIKKVLIKTGGNKTRTAKILKIDRMTLYSKLRRIGNIEMLYDFRDFSL